MNPGTSASTKSSSRKANRPRYSSIPVSLVVKSKTSTTTSSLTTTMTYHFSKLLSLTTVQLVFLSLLLVTPHCRAVTYENTKSVLEDKLAATKYSPDVRPLRNQSETLYVFASFELVSVVEINDVLQSFKCNGFLALFWFDQMLTWNASDYGGEIMITPQIKNIFKPRLIMLNTMDERDVFEDGSIPINVYSNGFVLWTPGSIFSSSCQLDLTKYPFDQQTCELKMILTNFSPQLLRFYSIRETVGFDFFTKNGEWDVVTTNVTDQATNISDTILSTLVVSFTLKRKSTFLVVSILLPIVFLSLLNLMVFLIPVDSGEKISYGITVLLALSVFMSIMSAMLPRSSESMPLIITYIFILLTISVLTVVGSIIIVKLHHMEEREEKSQRAKQNFRSVMPRVRAVNQVDALLKLARSGETRREWPNLKSSTLTGINNNDRESTPSSISMSSSTLTGSHDEPQVKVNRYKLIGRHIDIVCLIIFSLSWVGITIGFMVAIAT